MRCVGEQSPLSSAKFRWFFAARSVSLFGNAMAPVALAFAVLGASHQDGDLGLVLSARAGTMLVFVLFGGVIADRYPRDRVAFLGHLVAAAVQGTAAVILIEGRFDLVVIMALEAVSGLLSALTMPGLYGAVPQLVPTGQLKRANALLGFTKQIALITGPGLAGVVSGTIGGGWALAMDAVCYAAAAACLVRLRLPEVDAERRPGVVTELREGWAEFRTRPWLWSVTAAFAVIMLVHGAVWQVLGPVTAERSFGASGWGAVVAVDGAGILSMSLVMCRVRVTRLLAFGELSLAFTVLPVIPLALGAPLGWVLAMAFLGGLGSGGFQVAWDTTMQEHVPAEKLSRVMAFDALGSFCALPVGQIVAIPLAGAFGVQEVMGAGAAVWLVMALAPLAAPAVRRIEHGASEEREAATV